MSWISRLCRWCFEIPNDLSMSVTLCWCAVFQGELQQSSNCKPLWFLTCLSRAYCTWCYLFKAICTENILPPPPPLISSSHWHLKFNDQPPQIKRGFACRGRFAVKRTGHKWSFLPAILGITSLPYVEFPPEHIQNLKPTNSNLINHTLISVN